MQIAPSPLPPHPGVSQLRPPSPVSFHPQPTSSVHLLLDPAPALSSHNPFRMSPLAIPVPPFDLLPANPFLCMVPPLDLSIKSVPPATSSTGISDFNITLLVPLEGRVPPFPIPFADAAPAMTSLTQDQLLQALNLHFHNTNAILDHLVMQVTAATCRRPS